MQPTYRTIYLHTRGFLLAKAIPIQSITILNNVLYHRQPVSW